MLQTVSKSTICSLWLSYSNSWQAFYFFDPFTYFALSIDRDELWCANDSPRCFLHSVVIDIPESLNWSLASWCFSFTINQGLYGIGILTKSWTQFESVVLPLPECLEGSTCSSSIHIPDLLYAMIFKELNEWGFSNGIHIAIARGYPWMVPSFE